MISKKEQSNHRQLQQRLGYKFQNNKLLTRALTHRSHGSNHYERLEFLGDSILNFVIAEDLFNRFKRAREGKLSRLRAKMVRKNTLADIAREFDLGAYMIMGSGELKSGGFQLDSILSDTLEAIIGAIFVDAGLDVVRPTIISWFLSRLENLSLDHSLKDAKSRLQELLQSRQSALPRYNVFKTSGQSHNQTFYVECQSELLAAPVLGEGSSRRIAEQEAASLALLQLGVENDLD